MTPHPDILTALARDPTAKALLTDYLQGVERTLPGGVERTLPGGMERTLPGGVEGTLPPGVEGTLPGRTEEVLVVLQMGAGSG